METILLKVHKAMFRAHPPYFILCLILVPFGIGILLLLAWWLDVRTTTLTVTDMRTILNYGILSRRSSEIMHKHVVNIQLVQSLTQRLFDVGTLRIAGAGPTIGEELVIVGIPHPNKICSLINEHRG